ncbi:hypothetical protein ASF61_03315 [Duganella sp. Leaf126]|uniref:PEP-CTERM sorting domain-containing protein n=1 Tax=Duganella sp. Leaf126 TaxID=1736266 RepID=UPI0006FD87B3|nr:PEP-CTERM sorting domain-containing protein [Duganella sp. Leaf126]KQQ47674.1 hypothetical protein ASF61_03315 [Duganella sp. Leaf126]
MKTVLPAVLLTLAALSTTLASPSALAGADGTTRIDNITLGVIDLTPGDGAPAGYTLGYAESRLLTYLNTVNNGGSYTQTSVFPAPYGAGQAQLPANAGPGTAVASTAGGIGNLTSSAAADATLGTGNYLGAEGTQQLSLTLAPHSLLTVGGDLFTQVRRTLDPGVQYALFGWASVFITDADGTTTSLLTRESALNTWDPLATLAERQERFLLAFANPGDSALLLNLRFLALTDITVSPVPLLGGVAPVPEPGTYALLLSGLLLTGTLARRRAAGGQRPIRRPC